MTGSSKAHSIRLWYFQDHEMWMLLTRSWSSGSLDRTNTNKSKPGSITEPQAAQRPEKAFKMSPKQASKTIGEKTFITPVSLPRLLLHPPLQGHVFAMSEYPDPATSWGLLNKIMTTKKKVCFCQKTCLCLSFWTSQMPLIHTAAEEWGVSFQHPRSEARVRR